MKVMEAEKRQAAEARQVAADARTERIEADKKTAIVARRQLQAARFSRQEKLYREIRTREETEKLIVEERCALASRRRHPHHLHLLRLHLTLLRPNPIQAAP